MSKKHAISTAWQTLLTTLLAIAVTAVLSPELVAQPGPGLHCCGDPGCGACYQHCPECDEYCCVSCVQVPDYRFCFKVDYATICVPKVKLPWESCCEPRCAKTKQVKILLIHKFKCPVCRCRWEVKQPEPCPRGPYGEVYADGEYQLQGPEVRKGDHPYFDGYGTTNPYYTPPGYQNAPGYQAPQNGSGTAVPGQQPGHGQIPLNSVPPAPLQNGANDASQSAVPVIRLRNISNRLRYGDRNLVPGQPSRR